MAYMHYATTMEEEQEDEFYSEPEIKQQAPRHNSTKRFRPLDRSDLMTDDQNTGRKISEKDR